MVIVSGSFDLAPEDRDAFIQGRLEAMRRSRAEAGCLEYVFSADPLEPGRVVLHERWESAEALTAHLEGMRSGPPPEGPQVRPLSSSIIRYDVSGETRMV